MTVTARDGSVQKADVLYGPGSVKNPATDAALEAKFLTNVEAMLGRDGAHRAAEVILSMDRLKNPRSADDRGRTTAQGACMKARQIRRHARVAARHRCAGDDTGAAFDRSSSSEQQQPALKHDVSSDLGNRSNGLLMESPQPSPNNRFVVIQVHPDHANNFNYFLLRELASRGYRSLALNYYGPEAEFEEFLQAIAAAVKYARSVPGVDKVVFATHSGGGPALTLVPGDCRERSGRVPGTVTSLPVQRAGT